MVLLLASALLLAPALLGQDVRAWQGLHEGLLMEAADGNSTGAISWYTGLLSGLPADDPSQGELHYWLGRALYAQGDYQGARQALTVAMTSPAVRPQAQLLMGQIDSQELRVRALPVSYDFTTGTGHFLHSYLHPGRGSIHSATPPGSDNPALAWSTEVLEREDDAIDLWLSPGLPGPEALSFRVRTREFTALLVLTADDDLGRRYIYPSPIVGQTESWGLVQARLSEFVLQDTGGLAEGHITPGTVVSISIWDRTSFGSNSRGTNVIYLDDLELH